MAVLRCRKKPMLSTLLAITALSVSVCLFTVAILASEEEAAAVTRLEQPGVRPVKFGGSNSQSKSQREILNIDNEALVARRRREGEAAEKDRSQQREPRTMPSGFHGSDVTVAPGSQRSAQETRSHPQLEERVSVEGKEEVVAVKNCTGPWTGYPSCKIKMEWMSLNWETDPCYADHGVDGSPCSFQRYLAEVEHFCPLLSPRSKSKIDISKAVVQRDLSPLVAVMSENKKFDWLIRRITSHWSNWQAALQSLEAASPFNHSRKTILIHIGALSDKAGFKFAENADHGGPLGEMVQWSDLIATLHLLGHSLHFSTEINQLRPFLLKQKEQGKIGGCPTHSETAYDAIYIDIVGLRHFKKLVKSRLQHYQCLFRVLDSFGTEPQFNFKAWKPPTRPKGDYGQSWGNWNFNPRQFLTMYPHTPDNSFLGFVVGNNKKNTTAFKKKDIGVVYGKEMYMWQGKRSYLDVISRYVDIHATIGTTQQKKNKVDPSVVPGYVINHGILDSTELHKLLQEAKVFIGLGFPYEGPAPLEAIASGCIFLNPKLSPPLDRYNSKFLKAKPTLRALTSQNPYTENFIGEPYVFTFDVQDSSSLVKVMEKIMHTTNSPGYLPYEFTYEGMLERVMVYLENQDFCEPHQWPTERSLITTISKEEESCKDACFREGLVCEPELFSLLNLGSDIVKAFSCARVVSEHSVHGPSYNSQTRVCSLQTTPLLHSCVGAEPKVQRLCPCRTYHKGQVALCSSCTRNTQS